MKQFNKTETRKTFASATKNSFEEFEAILSQHKTAILAGYENSDMQFTRKSINDLESAFGMFIAAEQHRTKDFDGSMKTIESESIGKVKNLVAEMSQEMGIAPEDIMDKVMVAFSKDLAAEIGESYEEKPKCPENWHSFVTQESLVFELNDMSDIPLGPKETKSFISILTSTVPYIDVRQMPCGHILGRFDRTNIATAISYASDVCSNTKAKYNKEQTEEIGYMTYMDENGMRCVRIDFDCM